MTNFKTSYKTALVLIALLQLSQPAQGSEMTVIDLSQIQPEVEHALQEIGEVFGLLKTINEIKAKFETVYEERFKDIATYPEMSLKDLGDEIINILDNTNELPEDIRENLKQIVNIKKMANNTNEIKAPHQLISEVLIQLANFKLARINEGMPVLLKYFSPQDIAKINQEIIAYRNSVEKLKIRKNYKSIDDIDTDLKKLGNKLSLILKNYPLYLSLTTQYANDKQPLTALEQAAEQMKLLRTFNYRIAQNKRK